MIISELKKPDGVVLLEGWIGIYKNLIISD